MASVFRPTKSLPIPDGAVDCQISGKPGVTYVDRRGRKQKRLVRKNKNGQLMMVHEYTHWWMRFRLPDGTEIRRKGFKDKTATEQEAHRREREAEQRAAGLIPVDRQHLQAPIQKHIEEFIENRRLRGGSERYYNLLRTRLTRTAKECGWITLSHLTPESFERFLYSTILREHPKGKTPLHYHAAVTTFLNWCVRNGRLLANPLQSIDQPPASRPTFERAALSLDQARRLLQVSGPRSIVYHTAMRTGLRRNELLLLQWQHVHVDEDNQAPHLAVPGTITKNGQDAIIRLPLELAKELRRLKPADLAAGQLVFRSIPKVPQFRLDLQAAGIPDQDANGKKVDFHSLRVTLCTHLLAANAPVSATMAVMRHSDARLTLKTYADQSKLEIGAVVDKLPPLLDDAGGDGQTVPAESEASQRKAASRWSPLEVRPHRIPDQSLN